MTVAIAAKTSPWVDLGVDHAKHSVVFHSHGDIVVRFLNTEMFEREFLYLHPNETLTLSVLHDGECLYYVYQQAPNLTEED
jgi:hypothetical protein